MKTNRKQFLKDIFLFKINKCSIITIAASIIINVLGHALATIIHLPLWLDSIGTMLVSIQFGPLAGIPTALISQPFFSLVNGRTFPYVVVSMLTAFLVGLFFPRKHREDALGIVTVAILTAFIGAAVCIPLNMHYYQGANSNTWGKAMYDMLGQTLTSRHINAFMSEFFIDFPDRVASLFLALLLVDFGEIQVFKKKQRTITKTMTGILVLLMAGSMLLASASPVYAHDLESSYETDTYGSREGLLSEEVNAVAQTKDGYLWVGTYAGLFKYNGIRFEAARVDERIRNVLALFADSKGRLWIGTNDSGVLCYDPETGDIRTFASGIGLDSNSIRVINEDTNGNIYLGTVRSITRISPEGNVKVFSDWDNIYYTRSLCSLEDGSMIGVSNGGVLFRIKDDQLLFTESFQAENGVYFTAASGSGNEVLVGTTGNTVAVYEVSGNDLLFKDTFTLTNHTYMNNLRFSSSYDGYFYCAADGYGFLSKSKQEIMDMEDASAISNISDVCVDEQGNIWFASGNHGLIKCSHTPFGNVFKDAGIASSSVNSVIESDGLLYVATDEGIKIVDQKSRQQVEAPWLSEIGNARIRQIMKDSKGNFWISTYSTLGLVRVDPKGNLQFFNEQQGGTLGGRMRSAIELSDGRILVASNMGLSFIQDDKVVATLGEADGLKNQYVLSMYERNDGSILAATDGDGIYIIKNDEITGHIGAPEGLDSSVVLRIVKGSEGFFYVTSNALYYDNGTRVRALKNFPYSNNFDILLIDGKCWITSSAGLYLVDEKALIDDGDYMYVLLNRNWGLDTNFTANSWNLIQGNEIYLCCSDGIREFSVAEYMKRNHSYQIHLEPIHVDDQTVREIDGILVIPPFKGRLSFSIAITNYTLSNPLVHYYLEGANDEGITCTQNEITPLDFTNLSYGTYKLHVQILDETTGQISSESIFTIKKQAMMFEKLYFRIYAYSIGVLLVFYIVWLFYMIHRRAQKIRGMQKEMSTDPMTGLYNKSASEKILTKICSESDGILLMIDLDSFKLVNDIYGHDMGDRILIRFAELIREAVGEGNMGGRLGGDEFIGFIKDTSEEGDVERVTRFLNKQIVKSAKEYMGADMNIPLGASIGAVRIPASGRDFSELFRYADKALYIVKQNGKHGYSFYHKGEDASDISDTSEDKNNLSRIKKIIGERNEGKGAFLVNFERFQVIYRFMNRDGKVNGNKNGFIRITIESPDGSKVTDEAKDAFEEALLTTLKKNDVVSRYSGHFFVLCNEEEENDFEAIVKKIEANWKESGEYSQYSIRTEIESVD